MLHQGLFFWDIIEDVLLVTSRCCRCNLKISSTICQLVGASLAPKQQLLLNKFFSK